MIRGETVEGSPNSFLLSEEQYGDFELEFDVKVHDSLNSGVQIRSREKTEADLATSGKEGKPAKDLGRFFGPQVEIESSPRSGRIYLRRGDRNGLAFTRAPGYRPCARIHEKRRVEPLPYRSKRSAHRDLYQWIGRC